MGSAGADDSAPATAQEPPAAAAPQPSSEVFGVVNASLQAAAVAAAPDGDEGAAQGDFFLDLAPTQAQFTLPPTQLQEFGAFTQLIGAGAAEEEDARPMEVEEEAQAAAAGAGEAAPAREGAAEQTAAEEAAKAAHVVDVIPGTEDPPSEEAGAQPESLAAAAAVVEVSAAELARLDEEALARWMAPSFSSEPAGTLLTSTMTAQLTTQEGITQIPSLAGEDAEVLRTVTGWAMELREESSLRMEVLTGTLWGVDTTGVLGGYRVFMGEAQSSENQEQEASKPDLPPYQHTQLLCSVAKALLRLEREAKDGTQLLGNLDFDVAAAGDSGSGDSPSIGPSDLSEPEVALLVCSKEEAAARKIALEAAMAAGRPNFRLRRLNAAKRGAEFTDKELAALAAAAVQGGAEGRALKTASLPETVADAGLPATGIVLDSEQQVAQQPEVPAAAAPASAAAAEPAPDGPDALDVFSLSAVPPTAQEPPQPRGNATTEDGRHHQQQQRPNPRSLEMPPTAAQLVFTGATAAEASAPVAVTAAAAVAGIPLSEETPADLPRPEPRQIIEPPPPSPTFSPPRPPGNDWGRLFGQPWAPSPPVAAAPAGHPAPPNSTQTTRASEDITPPARCRGERPASKLMGTLVPESLPEDAWPPPPLPAIGKKSLSAVPPLASAVQLQLPSLRGTQGVESQPVGSQDLDNALRVTALLADDLADLSQAAEAPRAAPALFQPRKRVFVSSGALKEAPAAAKAAAVAAEAEAGPSPKPARAQPKQQARQLQRPKRGATKSERRQEYLSRVTVPKGVARPDLQGGAPLVTKKKASAAAGAAGAAAPVAVANAAGGGAANAAQRKPATAVPAGRTPTVIPLSGLHDTAECFDDESSLATVPVKPPQHAEEMEEAAAEEEQAMFGAGVDVEQMPPPPLPVQPRKSPRRLSRELAAVVRKPTAAANRPPSKFAAAKVAKAAAAAAKAAAAAAVPGGHSDPFRFPTDGVLEAPSLVKLAAGPEMSPRRSRRNLHLPPLERHHSQPALQQAQDPPRLPYQPRPKEEVRDGLLVQNWPHPLVQTAPDHLSAELHSMANATVTVAVEKRGGGKGNKRKAVGSPAAAALSPAKAAKGGDKRRKPVATPPPPAVADSEDQTLAEYATTTRKTRWRAFAAAEAVEVVSPAPKAAADSKKLGCNKCRDSEGGCKRCRAWEDAGIYEQKMAEHEARMAKRKAKKEAKAKEEAAKAAKAQGRRSGRHSAAYQAPEPPAVTPTPQKQAAKQQSGGGGKATLAKRARETPQENPQPVAALPQRSTSAAQPLDRMTFLVSGSAGDFKKATEELIVTLGGKVMADIPLPPPQNPSRSERRLSVETRGVGGAAAPAVHAVVTDKEGARRVKCLYAAIKGLPVVGAGWLQECQKAGKRLPWEGKHLFCAPQEPAPAPVFAGLRLHLVTKSGNDGINLLLQHSGAAMVAQPKEVPGQGPNCDLVIVDDDVDAKTKDAMQRMARSLKVPHHLRSWAITAMKEGTLPGGWSPKPRGRRGHHAAAAAAAAAPPPVEEEEEEYHSMEAEEAAYHGGVDSMEVVVQEEEEEAPGEPEAAAPGGSRRTTAAGRREQRLKRKTPSTAAPQLSISLAPTPPADQTPAVPKWLGAAVAPPAGLPAITSRKYYKGVALGPDRIKINDFVELLPHPGEATTRVARVTALWAERDSLSGEDRAYGRFARFFRPEDTPFVLPFFGSQARNQVFSSSCIEDRVPLAAVAGRCTVGFPASVDQLAQQATPEVSGSGTGFVCLVHFDHEKMALTPLP